MPAGVLPTYVETMLNQKILGLMVLRPRLKNALLATLSVAQMWKTQNRQSLRTSAFDIASSLSRSAQRGALIDVRLPVPDFEKVPSGIFCTSSLELPLLSPEELAVWSRPTVPLLRMEAIAFRSEDSQAGTPSSMSVSQCAVT